MKKVNDEKNLKHGYIFLTGIILVLFAISLSIEIYLKGGFNFKEATPETVTDNTENDEHPEITLEIQNLTDGYKTKESVITIVYLTNIDNKAWINGQEVEVSPEGYFERKIDLNVGENGIIAKVEDLKGDKKEKNISVIREEEKKEEPKAEEKTETPKNNDTTKPIVQPEIKPEPKPDPEPQPQPITGLKLYCSITNTQPFVGQTVTLDCSVKDQNGNPVSGANGSVTVNWQSGSASYNLPSSNSNGSSSISFTVPEGNKGKISGSIRVSKYGLTVNSNFSITVQ